MSREPGHIKARQQWKGAKRKERGHTYVAENANGKVSFYDPQNGDEDCSGYLSLVRKRSLCYFQMNDAGIRPGFDINTAVEARKP